jgi:hypothetical protein
MSQPRQRLLAIYVLVALAFALTLWKVQNNTSEISRAFRQSARENVALRSNIYDRCVVSRRTTQAIIDMNLKLIAIDQDRGDGTDKALSAQRLATVKQLQPLVPTCEGIK